MNELSVENDAKKNIHMILEANFIHYHYHYDFEFKFEFFHFIHDIFICKNFN
jgi:hypothetical protein